MRNAGDVLLGACLASAALQQCSCFTATPRVRVASTTARSSSSASSSSAARFSSSSPRPPAASSSPHTTTRRQRHHRRRKPLLSYGTAGRTVEAESSAGPPGAAEVDERSTSQQLEAEVAARRARAWGLVGFPAPPPSGGLFGEEAEASGPAAAGGRGAAARAGAATVEKDAATAAAATAADTAVRERRRWHQDDEQQQEEEEQQRLLDMTRPPPELLAAARTRSVGDIAAAAEHVQEQQQISAGGGGQGDGEEEEEDGAGMWASRGLLAGAAMLYGTNFGCVKLLEESVPMSLAAALRFSVALVPFIPFLKKVNPGVFRAGAEVGVLNAIGYWAQSESLMTTTASKSAFICSLAVVFVPLLDVLLGSKATPTAAATPEVAGEKSLDQAEGKKRGGVFAAMNGPWFPALLAAAGVACLELIGVEGGPNSGDVWALVQPLCFGLGFWLTERSSRKYPDEIFGLVAAQLLTVAVLAVGWCVQAGDLPLSLASLRETVLPASGSLAVPVSLMWTGLVTTSLTVFGETLAMQKVSAAESTIILSTEPIWGTAFAACLLGESIGWNTGLGAILIVSACTWSSVGPALQTKMLSLVAAAAGASSVVEGGVVDVDDLAETVSTVIKEIVKD